MSRTSVPEFIRVFPEELFPLVHRVDRDVERLALPEPDAVHLATRLIDERLAQRQLRILSRHPEEVRKSRIKPQTFAHNPVEICEPVEILHRWSVGTKLLELCA